MEVWNSKKLFYGSRFNIEVVFNTFKLFLGSSWPVLSQTLLTFFLIFFGQNQPFFGSELLFGLNKSADITSNYRI